VITIAGDKEKREAVLMALSDPTRAEIVQMLSRGERTASEIHAAFSIAAPAVSRHLRVLREAGLVEERRPESDRRVRLYALCPEALEELAAWLMGLSQAWQSQLQAFKDFVSVRAGKGDKGGKK
jgi:DNA-binding transcriptional ArsR family regulator